MLAPTRRVGWAGLGPAVSPRSDGPGAGGMCHSAQTPEPVLQNRNPLPQCPSFRSSEGYSTLPPPPGSLPGFPFTPIPSLARRLVLCNKQFSCLSPPRFHSFIGCWPSTHSRHSAEEEADPGAPSTPPGSLHDGGGEKLTDGEDLRSAVGGVGRC